MDAYSLLTDIFSYPLPTDIFFSLLSLIFQNVILFDSYTLAFLNGLFSLSDTHLTFLHVFS